MEWIFSLVPVMAMSIPLLAIWTGHRQKVLANKQHVDAATLTKTIERLTEENKALEERMQTIETIVTLDQQPRESQRVRVGADLDPVEQEVSQSNRTATA